MIKKFALCLGIAAFFFLASGCETCKGAAKGTGCAAASTGKGIRQDCHGIVHAVVTADNWVKENLW